MVFRNGGFVREEEKWYYDGNVIDMNLLLYFRYIAITQKFHFKFNDIQLKKYSGKASPCIRDRPFNLKGGWRKKK
jgi:hypothetical protein